MAEAADSTTETAFAECGLCYENDELKRLPCSPGHILCVTCLTRDSAETQIIICPFCKQVFEDEVDALPSANSPLDEFRCCDVCRRKDEKYKLAQHYCVYCKKRFCKSHHEGHNVALDDHQMIPMSEYLKEYRKMETRYCTDHGDQVYSLACKNCYGVFCTRCSPWKNQCADGNPHQATDLDDLVKRLIDKIAENKVWIVDKEETILGIVKELTRVISDWGSDTEEMIQLIHQARDKQIAEMTAKYEALEKRLTEMRNNSMTEVSHFLDGDIGTKLNKLTREIRRLDTRIFTQHKVDVIHGYKETERLCDELMQMKVPVYKPSENHVYVSIADKEHDCEINAQILAWTGSLVTSQSNSQPIPVPTPLPKSLKLLRKVNVGSRPESVVHHLNYTYAGLNNQTIVKISDEGQATTQFVNFSPYYPNGVLIHNDLLYVLGYVHKDTSRFIMVFDLAGKLVSQWNYGESAGSRHSKMCIVGDQLVVCDKTKKCLAVYSLTGNFIKEISCQNISNSTVCMSAASHNSVIVSDYKSMCLFRVDIETGNVLWTSQHVFYPVGVACYRDQYVLVTNCNANNKIWILDMLTGNHLGKMVGVSGKVSSAVDLLVCGDTLVVPRHNEHLICYYQIVS